LIGMLELLYCEVSVILEACDEMLELRKVRGRLLKWIMRIRVIDAKKIEYKEEKGTI
jgi:hypothetical protein